MANVFFKAILVFSASISVLAQEPANSKSYAFSDGFSEYSCSLEKEPLTLIWGVFAQSQGGLSGRNLHLFPNKQFAITAWCDVCVEEVIQRGSYTFSNGQVTLNYAAIKKAPTKVEHWDFLSGCKLPAKEGHNHIHILVKSDKWDKSQSSISTDHVLFQNHHYEDWAALSKTFSNIQIKSFNTDLILPRPPTPPLIPYEKPESEH